MWIQFTRNRLRRIIAAIINGRPIASPGEGRFWPDSDLLAVAGACLAEIMRRRDYVNAPHCDYHLAGEDRRAHGNLSHRLQAAVAYAVNAASNYTNDVITRSLEDGPEDDKTYTAEVVYDDGHFHPRKRRDNEFPPEANRMPHAYRCWECIEDEEYFDEDYDDGDGNDLDRENAVAAPETTHRKDVDVAEKETPPVG